MRILRGQPEALLLVLDDERLLKRPGELVLDRGPRLRGAHAPDVDPADRDSVLDQVVARGVIRVHAIDPAISRNTKTARKMNDFCRTTYRV
jgi:hypothetical protein